MTKREFIDAKKYLLHGLIADAVVRQRQGGELSLFLKMTFDVCESELGKIYDEVRAPVKAEEPPKPPANGRQLPPVKVPM